MAKGIFKGMAKAKVTGPREKYLVADFDGDVKVVETLLKETRAKGDAFIVTLEIVTTNKEDEHPVGSRAAWYVSLQDKDIAFSNMLGFMGALGGMSDSEEIEENGEELTSMLEEAIDSPDDNDLIGEVVHVKTLLVKTKADKDFTRHEWSPNTED